MTTLTEQSPDVVVVGAGPVGLLSAIELTLGGARVLVLDRLNAPSTVAKAQAIGPLGIEALQRRGMADAIKAAEQRLFATMKPGSGPAVQAISGRTGPVAPAPQRPRPTPHFGGLTLIRAELQADPERLLSPVSQQAAEAMLTDRAHALGIEVRRGHEVTGFSQDARGVTVEWMSGSGTESSGTGHLHCAYLVGCDGGRSRIRKMAGFDFPGTPPTMTMYNVAATLDHSERLEQPGWQHTDGGMYRAFMGRLILMDFGGAPADRDAPLTREEIEEVLRRVSRADVRVTALEGGNRWTDNTRLVDSYRRGRVLLAGDAAHIHSPFGGQGLSLGLGDAANLGWKLAAVLRGELPESLLDSYTAERRPVAEAVLENTRAQAAIMRPDPQSSAMRRLMARLLGFDDVNRSVGEMMLSLAAPTGPVGPGVPLGDRPLHVKGLETTLYALMQDGRGVLLDASSGRAASGIVRSCTQWVRCVQVSEGPSLLIRPDACLAWTGAAGSTGGLEAALHRWFTAVPASQAS